ncbi:MAG: AAC(3) family N-acetyltransferase [Eubacteriales bacterium]|nr:AAC(3) family N-acetyltransferase [Eubacteriales bacterium]
MPEKAINKSELVTDLKQLGLQEGDTVIVHTSLKKIGYVCGGAQTVIEALIDVVGENGTIVMPAQSWKNLDPETGVHWEVDESQWDYIRENWPAYDKNLTPTNTMGAVAEMFRQWPGSIRTDHPARSLCAWGRHAAYITRQHTLSDIFGEGSPLARLYELDAKVLLLGVGYDKNTSLHLADVRAEYPGKHNCMEHSAILENGVRVWKEYETLFVDGEDFEDIGAAFEKECDVKIGNAGKAEARLMNQRTLVDFAVSWMEKNR